MEKSAKIYKKIKFSDHEKSQLISSVKKQKHIWDKSQKLHCNRNALRAAWKQIGQEIGKPEDACRQNWRSILDSKRYYRQKRRAPKKSGSGCDLELLSDESEDPWEFSKELEIMTDTSEMRTTICSQLLFSPESEPWQDIDFEEIEVLPSTSSEDNKPSYSYKTTSSSRKNLHLNEMKAGVSQVADAMTTLVNIAKNKENNANTPFLNYLASLLLK